jgi:multidrug resistance efflux pump
MSEINNWLNDHPEIRQTAPKWILDKIEANPKDAEIERLKEQISKLSKSLNVQDAELDSKDAEIERLKAKDLDFLCWMSDESQIVSGCRNEYERGRYEAFRQALDRQAREAAKHE